MKGAGKKKKKHPRTCSSGLALVTQLLKRPQVNITQVDEARNNPCTHQSVPPDIEGTPYTHIIWSHIYIYIYTYTYMYIYIHICLSSVQLCCPNPQISDN